VEEDVGAPMMPAQALCDQLRAAGVARVEAVSTLESAVEALGFKYDAPQRILVAGSLYLAGHILRGHR
jgi:dihydrofolate synthase/folylpolyglutamate synthase